MATNIPFDGTDTVSDEDFHRLEFHRHAVALMPDPADKRPGVAVRLEAAAGRHGGSHTGSGDPKSVSAYA